MTVKGSVADVPPALIDTAPIKIAGGAKVGKNAKVDLVRLTPLTTSDKVALTKAPLRLIDVTTGGGTTVNEVLDVVVLPATVTEIIPLDAPTGTMTTSVVLVAETTVAATPLNNTVLAAGVGLKP